MLDIAKEAITNLLLYSNPVEVIFISNKHNNNNDIIVRVSIIESFILLRTYSTIKYL